MMMNGKKNSAINGEPRRHGSRIKMLKQTFLYLGATMDKTGGTEAVIRKRLDLARSSFLTSNNVYGRQWRSAQYSTTMRILNTYLITVLLFSP